MVSQCTAKSTHSGSLFGILFSPCRGSPKYVVVSLRLFTVPYLEQSGRQPAMGSEQSKPRNLAMPSWSRIALCDGRKMVLRRTMKWCFFFAFCFVFGRVLFLARCCRRCAVRWHCVLSPVVRRDMSYEQRFVGDPR